VVFDGIDAGQIIVVNCSDVTLHNINVSNTVAGIAILYSDTVDISDCIVSHNYDGVVIWRSYNASFSHCVIAHNRFFGILTYLSSNGTFFDCTVSSNDFTGIYMHSSTQYAILSCNISSNGQGLWLDSSSDNLITGNTICANSYSGLYFFHNTVATTCCIIIPFVLTPARHLTEAATPGII
jgi:parallel beta-helix repeat protein